MRPRRTATVLVSLVALVGVGTSAAPVAAASEPFVAAETARLGRHRQVVEAAPPSRTTRANLYAARAAAATDLDATRFGLSLQLARRAELVTEQRRLRQPLTALRILEPQISATVDVIEERQAELAAIEGDLVEDSALEEFGLDFAVFPIEETTEFVNSWGAARSGGRGHKGTDILGPYGTDLRAIEDGVIERTSNSALGGLSLYFQGDSGARYFYAHLSAMAEFGDGDRVHAGETIAYNGDSGNARGTPHLHFQWAPDGGEGWRNPYPLLAAVWAQDRHVAMPQR